MNLKQIKTTEILQRSNHIKGQIISQVKSYHRSIHITGQFISKVKSYQRSSHITGQVISQVNSYQRSNHIKGQVILQVEPYQMYSHMKCKWLAFAIHIVSLDIKHNLAGTWLAFATSIEPGQPADWPGSILLAT